MFEVSKLLLKWESKISLQIPPLTRKLVISRTVPLLDHKKRLVRRAAADARNAWMLVT